MSLPAHLIVVWVGFHWLWLLQRAQQLLVAGQRLLRVPAVLGLWVGDVGPCLCCGEKSGRGERLDETKDSRDGLSVGRAAPWGGPLRGEGLSAEPMALHGPLRGEGHSVGRPSPWGGPVRRAHGSPREGQCGGPLPRLSEGRASRRAKGSPWGGQRGGPLPKLFRGEGLSAQRACLRREGLSPGRSGTRLVDSALVNGFPVDGVPVDGVPVDGPNSKNTNSKSLSEAQLQHVNVSSSVRAKD